VIGTACPIVTGGMILATRIASGDVSVALTSCRWIDAPAGALFETFRISAKN